MKLESTNCYQRARESAGMTQERAAEVLGYSVGSVKSWERAENPEDTFPNNQVVAKMVDAYGTPWLAVQHLRESDIGQMVVPEIQIKPIAGAVLQLLDRVQNFEDFHKAIIRIASDGVISEDEQAEWSEIEAYLKELARAVMEVQYAKTERE